MEQRGSIASRQASIWYLRLTSTRGPSQSAQWPSLTQRAFEAAERRGDRTFAGYSCAARVFDLIAAGETLRDVQLEAERKLGFVRKRKV